jgi:hypothetical protein
MSESGLRVIISTTLANDTQAMAIKTAEWIPHHVLV